MLHAEVSGVYHLLFTQEPCYSVPPQRVTIELCFTCLNSFSSTIIYYETTNVELTKGMHFLMQNGSHRIKVSYKIEHKLLHVSFGIFDHLLLIAMCSSRKYPDPHHGGNFT